MATPEFLMPGGRPSSPVSTTWFEFLLKPELLLKHLANPHAVPGAHQLIFQFLQQANSLESQVNNAETKNADNSSKDQQPTVTAPEEDIPQNNLNTGPKVGDSPDEQQYYKKKVQALKLLALKIAAYGGWNLSALMNSIPGPAMLQLLQELMVVAGGKLEENEDTLIELLTQENQSNQSFFALLLYQRWCVLTVLQDCLPRKPTKVNSIPVPGLTEPVIQMVGISEEKLARIKKLFGKCKSTLIESLARDRQACVPTHECFDFSASAMGEFKLNWEKGDHRGIECWGKQIAFDLGAVYFYETDYYKALDLFTKVESWSKAGEAGSASDSIDTGMLTGYLKACKALVNNKQYEDNIINRFNSSITNKDIQNLVAIFMDNLAERKLPLAAADQAALLLNQIREESAESFTEVHMRLECICCVMYTLREDSYYLHKTATPAMSSLRNQYLIDVFAAAIQHCTATEKKRISSYLLELIDVEGKSIRSVLIAKEPIKGLLGSALADEVPLDNQMDTSQSTSSSLLDPEGYDVSETTLAISYIPDKIWSCLCNISAAGNLKIVIDFWKLPKDLDRLFNELKMDATTVCTYVLIAKAKELIAIKEHTQAVMLLNAADKTIREISGKIVKIIRWEVLYSNLLSTKLNDGKSITADIDKKVKSCLYALKVDSDIYPNDSLVMECVSYLLLSKEWEYLSSLHDTRVAFTEYARQLINVCKELPNLQYAKAPGNVLWDTSVVIFSLQNIGKRVRLGNQAMLPKDTYKKFILTINEPLVLSVLISLLTRVYSLKNTDVDIDRNNNFSSVWPDTISPALMSALDEVYIRELMMQLVQHALSINSLESTWLKTYAEIQYAIGNHRDAMKYYLQAASVASNNFMQPISFYVFDAEVYTRLVKCCVHLKHFTQAAVLSQFYEEPDYMAAFKYLQEKNCQDGMDIYYDCLWDVNILEFLINLHGKRGELDKKQQLIQLIGNPELNTNNPEAILQTFKTHKKAKFFRLITKHYS